MSASLFRPNPLFHRRGSATSALRLTRLALPLLALVSAAPAFAQADNTLHGRLELQDSAEFNGPDSIQAALGDRTGDDGLANLRLTWEPTWGNWGLQAHYLVTSELGPDVLFARQEAGLLPPPPSTLFNLTDTFENHGRLIASQTIDRLAVTYSTPQWVVRLGRQAITWGSGLVFRPMDLFDPFSPSATDTEYKPGVDMLYVQRLFADGSDLQLVVTPRPRYCGRSSGAANASSAALHYTTLFQPPAYPAARRRPWRLGRRRRRQRRARRLDLERRAHPHLRARWRNPPLRGGQHQQCSDAGRPQRDGVRRILPQRLRCRRRTLRPRGPAVRPQGPAGTRPAVRHPARTTSPPA